MGTNFMGSPLLHKEGAMIAHQLPRALGSELRALSQTSEPGASMTRTDVAAAWVVALTVISFVALLF
jgi:hypothetical protein